MKLVTPVHNIAIEDLNLSCDDEPLEDGEMPILYQDSDKITYNTKDS